MTKNKQQLTMSIRYSLPHTINPVMMMATLLLYTEGQNHGQSFLKSRKKFIIMIKS